MKHALAALLRWEFSLFVLLLLCGCLPALAQDTANTAAMPAFPQPRAVPHAAQRYEIDAKRAGVEPTSADALPRSREFIRIDSTYYVGWFFEGAYKYSHAADYLGYKNAIAPLERALATLERDYRPELRTRTSDLLTYINNFRYQLDYTQIAYYLMNCYANIEDPESVFRLLRRVQRWNFQRDYYMDFYNMMAWTVHRNRYYTSEKYSFLRNSIDQNDALAQSYLDSAMRRIAVNKRLNSGIFQPGYEKDEYLTVYHYRALLYSYALSMDSAARYYNLMRGTPYFPHNNFASFRMIAGDFKTAEEEYQLAATQDAGDKRLQEWVYFTSMLYLYKHQPARAIAFLKDVIKSNGSTPGFGWYNIALARAYYYDGQIEESKRHDAKAAEFKELHIGTTLTQSHYDFSIQLLSLLNKEASYEMERFENANWWYHPAVLARMAGKLGERYLQQFLIINQFAQNPERDRVIYKLFSTESITTWDEIWYLIRDFSTRYFLDRFQKEIKQDKRPAIRKYFQLFVARLHMKQGHYRQAYSELKAILDTQKTDPVYEKLFLARTYESLAGCAGELKQHAERDRYLYLFYQTYPQLIPYSGLKANLSLTATGEGAEAAIKRLKQCNINWTAGGPFVPRAFVHFYTRGTTKMADYWVLDAQGNYLIPKQTVSYRQAEAFGIGLAYRFFGVGQSQGPELVKGQNLDAG